MLRVLLSAAIAVVLAAAAPSRLPAASNLLLSLDEKQIVTSCEANFAPAKLSPSAAAVCINKLHAANSALLLKLKAIDAPRAVELAAKTNALKNLKDLLYLYSPQSAGHYEAFQQIEPEDYAASLAAKLAELLPSETYQKLGLGPEPEALFDWTQKYAPAQYELIKEAARTWETLDSQRVVYLAGQGINQRDWIKTPLGGRYSALRTWANKTAAPLYSLDCDVAESVGMEQVAQTAKAIWKDLAKPDRAKLKKHIQSLAVLIKAKQEMAQKLAAGGGTEKDRLLAIQSRLAELKASGAEAQFDYLSSVYDLKPILNSLDMPAPIITKPARQAAPLSDNESRQLSQMLRTALQQEIMGTKAGDALLRFYADKSYSQTGSNQFTLDIQPISEDLTGAWLPVSRRIVFSKQAVAEWMARKNYTANDLVTKKSALKELARYLAPTFVHEATHQQQDAWISSSQIAKQSVRETETEAFSKSALFVMEKARKEAAKNNGNYALQISESHLNQTRIMQEEGIYGMRRYVAPLYDNMPSLEYSAVTRFDSARFIAEELAARKQANILTEQLNDRNRVAADSVTTGLIFNRETVKRYKTAALESVMDANFTQYKAYFARQEETAQTIAMTRDEILSGDFGPPVTVPEIKP